MSAQPNLVRPKIPLQPHHALIDVSLIENIVQHFYRNVRKDPALAPVFEAAIGDKWEPHIETMVDFWSSVMKLDRRYNGRPLVTHQALSALRPEHFNRWLTLFKESVEEICPDEVSILFINRANRIADSLQRGIFGNAP